MNIRQKREWEIGESTVTSESNYYKRRTFIKGLVGISLGTMLPFHLKALPISFTTKENGKYVPDLQVTAEKLFTKYNNFYEFSFDKDDVYLKAQELQTDNWKIDIKGLVDNPMTIDAGELAKKFSIEQRIYRHRCVETWSAVVPWDGFAFSELVKMVQPKATAKFVKFSTFYNPEVALNQKYRPDYPWPYTEGLTIEEAKNELTFLSVGIYGKPLPNQNGAPIRLVVPWKYGFKSIKSITAIEFTDTQPLSLWSQLIPGEYGFYANVNPEVSHPRWSQKYDRPLGVFFGKTPTLLFNGYEKQVAYLYKGLDLRENY